MSQKLIATTLEYGLQLSKTHSSTYAYLHIEYCALIIEHSKKQSSFSNSKY